ncbi:MAG: hypothetical protein SFT81_01555 [Candidatus Caenarcaniphilales bacterium]|nr:hypothetical protein [Candidatus Caenarcaniphilales bacterium]
MEDNYNPNEKFSPDHNILPWWVNMGVFFILILFLITQFGG